MLLDFEVQRCTRCCAATDRALEPGDECYSVLEIYGADVIRKDYCSDAWKGAPDTAFGWWKSRVPEPTAKKIKLAPNDVLLELFDQLAGREEQQDLRYVLALLLVRRRVLRVDVGQDHSHDESSDAPMNHTAESMTLYCPKRETAYDIAVAMPSGERIDEIQQQLSELLVAGAIRSESQVASGRFTKSVVSLLAVTVLLSASGATCQRQLMMNPFAAPGPAAPQVLMEGATRDQIIAAVNQNSSRVQSLTVTGATITIPDTFGLPLLSGNIAAERPGRFRLTAGTAVTGQEMDLGSNDELFWLWVRRNQPPAVYFCRHAQFANSNIRQMMPVEPSWLLAALGMVDLDPASVFDGPLPSPRGLGTVELRSWLPSASGTLQRVTVIDARRAWVLEQHIYDQAGTTLLASAVAESHRYYPAEQVSLPERISIQLPAANLRMKINLGVVQINQLMADRAQLWALPTFDGYPQYDLGGAVPGTPLPGRPAAQAAPSGVVPAGFFGYPTTGYPATPIPTGYASPPAAPGNTAINSGTGYDPLPQYGQRAVAPPASFNPR